MKARRKSDGKIIEVEAAVYNLKNGKPYHKCLSDGHYYPTSELDLNLDSEDTVIQGWVARDSNGDLWTYTHKPIRSDKSYWLGEVADFALSNDMLPNLTWSDDPQECEIIIKRKKNG